jgi:predicted P-loop ATPase
VATAPVDLGAAPVLHDPKALRPIHNATAINERPASVAVIVVQDEDSLATAQLIDNHVTTIANGNHKKYDWSPLHGRDVFIWPNPDAKGYEAAAALGGVLFGKAKNVSVVKGLTQTLCAAGETKVPEQLVALIKSHSTPIKSAQKQDFLHKGSSSQSKSVAISWQEMGLESSDGKLPHINLSNVSLILQRDPNFSGKIWLDTFRDKIYHTVRSDVSELWTDADTRRTAAYVQQSLKLPKVSTLLMHESVQHASECNPHNSVTEWLNSLHWNGTSRLNDWLTDTLGVEKNEYTQAVARNWPIAMVARAFQPGCKFDHMPVLEGKQGLNKTTFLEVLGGEWYKSLPMSFGEKDFLMAIQGAWLVEIPDMTGFSRREHSAVLATITIRVDEYRKSYGRTVESHPRIAIFAATSEKDNYLKNSNGRRRYWPLRCKHIDLNCLRQQREQIFAEAVVRYRAGETYWEMPETTDNEQLSRTEHDAWAQKVLDWADDTWAGAGNDMKRASITSTLILSKALEIPLKDQDQMKLERIGIIMRSDGWETKHTARARLWFKP